MSADKEKNNVSLTTQSSQRLSVRATLVKRGLQDICEHPNAALIAWNQPAVISTVADSALAGIFDWNHPSLRGTVLDLYEDPLWGIASSPGIVSGFDYTTFLCEIENTSDNAQHLDQKTIAVFYRSSSTGVVPFPAANILLPSRSITLAPHTCATDVLIEIAGGSVDGKSSEESVEEILKGHIEILACDRTSGSVILFSTR
jgi:hypothetical protein